jgi:DNA mismatch repair protein MutS2
VEVQVGVLRVRSRLEDIQRKGEEETPLPPAPPGPAVRKLSPPPAAAVQYPSPGMELDLRGQRAEDSLLMLERHLESAYLAGLPFVRIIHGKGTGRLRQVVRQALQHSPHVKDWERGLEEEGGDGVTVARIAPE